jgi:hypothetical protein
MFFFHYTQAIWRKAQLTGLQIPYRDNDDVKTLVRRAALLPLIPLNKIEDVWFAALEDRDEADLTVMTEKEQGTVLYINWPKNFLGVKCALIKA